MQALVIDTADLSGWAVRLWWPVLRIGGFVSSAPVLNSTTVPPRIKIVLTLALAFLLAPSITVPAALSIFSGPGVLAAVRELAIGIAIGMVVQVAFEAFTLAGQMVAITMGLGFATLIDPQRGANTTVMGQLFMILAVLTYLSMDGHLMLLGALANSYVGVPIGGAGVDRNLWLTVGLLGGRIFETGLLIALPAVIALILINIALGVVTRAAPQLNLFGIGFPITLFAGFLVLYAGMDGVMSGISIVIHGALTAVVNLVAARAPAVP
ncbi:MAG: flagellar biosynthetic protein FliR [Gammaproteobacteria bacterium]|nr:flagellar biosynthetic protein FliR [Gammaproteobacteria bacterium]